ncbi:MAG: HEPN domain-containing protein [Leptospiraceae bacterium]|nr:HEPN domain-containing protein [Leptospiraceae bacterium]MCP5496386.1 HEPN domain-containing protein [Leptospiraceae bacterium]
MLLELDRYYIPTRYPDSLPDITPSKAFGKNDGQTAFEIASIFIDKVKEIVVV